MQETDKEKLKAFQKKMHDEGAAGFADGPCPWDAWDESGAQAGRGVVWEGRARRIGKRKVARRSNGERILSGLTMIALATMAVGIAGVYFSAEQPQRVAWTAVQPTPIPLPWHEEGGGDRSQATGLPRPAPRIVEIDTLPPTGAGPAIQAVEAPAGEDMPSPAAAGHADLTEGADAMPAQSATAAQVAGDHSTRAIEIVATPTAVLLTDAPAAAPDHSGSGDEIDPQLAMEIATAPAVDAEPAGFAPSGWESPAGNPFLASAAGDTPPLPAADTTGGEDVAGMSTPAPGKAAAAGSVARTSHEESSGDGALHLAAAATGHAVTTFRTAGRPDKASSGMIIRDVEPQAEAAPPASEESVAPVEPAEPLPEAPPQGTESEPTSALTPADQASVPGAAAPTDAVTATGGEDDAETLPPQPIEAAEDTPAEMSSDFAAEGMDQAHEAAPATAAVPAPSGEADEDALAETPAGRAAEASETTPAEAAPAAVSAAEDEEPVAADAADAHAPQDEPPMLQTAQGGNGSATSDRPAGKWVVNLASYNHMAMAKQKLVEFRAMGVDAEIQSATVDDRIIHRIRVGGFANSRAAIAGIAPLEKTTGLKGLWISRR